MRRLDLLPLLQIRLPPHPPALPLLIAVDLLSLFPALQVAPRVFAELAFRTGRSAPLEPLLLRHDDTSGGKPRSAPGPPARDGRASARPSVARGRAGGVRTYGRGGAMKTVLAIALSLAFPAAAAKEEMEVRNQGAVKAHVWTSTGGLETARRQLRALTALSN